VSTLGRSLGRVSVSAWPHAKNGTTLPLLGVTRSGSVCPNQTPGNPTFAHRTRSSLPRPNRIRYGAPAATE